MLRYALMALMISTTLVASQDLLSKDKEDIVTIKVNNDVTTYSQGNNFAYFDRNDNSYYAGGRGWSEDSGWHTTTNAAGKEYYEKLERTYRAQQGMLKKLLEQSDKDKEQTEPKKWTFEPMVGGSPNSFPGRW